MTTQEILKELETYGDPQTKRTLMRHGAQEPFFGVKVADLKKILKKTKKNHHLSLELYVTGNSDAMYLAGLMADERQITAAQLTDWLDKAYWFYLNEFAVPWVAAETPFGFELGLKWIQSDREQVASAGWATLSYYAGVHEDVDLDIKKYRELLDNIAVEIHFSQVLLIHSDVTCSTAPGKPNDYVSVTKAHGALFTFSFQQLKTILSIQMICLFAVHNIPN